MSPRPRQSSAQPFLLCSSLATGLREQLGLVRELHVHSTVARLQECHLYTMKGGRCHRIKGPKSPQAAPWHSSCLCSPLTPGISVPIGAFRRSTSTPLPTSQLTLRIRLPKRGGGFPKVTGLCANHTQPRAKAPGPACCPLHHAPVCFTHSFPFPSLSSFHPSSPPQAPRACRQGRPPHARRPRAVRLRDAGTCLGSAAAETPTDTAASGPPHLPFSLL